MNSLLISLFFNDFKYPLETGAVLQMRLTTNQTVSRHEQEATVKMDTI